MLLAKSRDLANFFGKSRLPSSLIYSHVLNHASKGKGREGRAPPARQLPPALGCNAITSGCLGAEPTRRPISHTSPITFATPAALEKSYSVTSQ